MDSVTVFPPAARLYFTSPPSSRRHSAHLPRKSSWGNPEPSSSQEYATAQKEQRFEDIELCSNHSDVGEDWNSINNITKLGLSFQADENLDIPDSTERFSMDDVDYPVEFEYHRLDNRPFNRWMLHLQKRGVGRRRTHSGSAEQETIRRQCLESAGTKRRASHKKSSSQSSSGFVTAVRSASISLASFSVAPRSRRTEVSSRYQRTDKSSRASQVARASEDTSYNTRNTIIDQAVTNRSLQRRRILEEIISTEESYIGDVKFLMNVYVTLLASIPSLSASLRASINRNLSDIVALHEEILGDLHRIVPSSEYVHHLPISLASPATAPAKAGHQRWRSLDAVGDRSVRATWPQRLPGVTADPKVAAEVAKAFGKKMNRFFVYEEYGAKYELMIRDVASAYRTMPQWEMYQKGLETLATSLSSINSQMEGKSGRKALTTGDLLVKPIQRICKYPLLFAELLKQTPVYDCPTSHSEIETVLARLREATKEINTATDDPRMRSVMEKTWLLQDRIVFESTPGVTAAHSTRALGHIHLCGVLHVSWQTKQGVDGQYMACLLYREFLLLAIATKAESNELAYLTQACIGLSNLRVEDVDNGRGMQCHTAPFSWKLVFECDHQLYEITMSACSPKEELEWRSRLNNHSNKETHEVGEQSVFPSLSLKIKPLGAVFGKPGTIARRMSIHRATTVGPTSLCQVIIKNTNACKEGSSYTAINRSQSLLTTNRIPVLAPARAERIKLENILADVWTKDILPFPGMTSRARSEYFVRTSAHSMMRKLSVASITSNFSKRSVSVASTKTTVERDELGYSRATELSGKRSGDTLHQVQHPKTTKPQITIFQFEKENNFRSGSTESLFTLGPASTSPGSAMRRIATFQGKKSWVRDGERIITPPLRTSSANSFNQSRVSSLTTVADSQLADQSSLSPLLPLSAPCMSDKSIKKNKNKALGMKKGVMAEGIRNFFR